MNKRQLVIVVMATFCLTTLLMMPLVRSTGEPDPWADVSGPIPGQPDGIVNMRDVAYEIVHFNENVTGIPRDVNVTNWPETYRVQIVRGVNVSWSTVPTWYEIPNDLSLFDVEGFSRMTVSVDVESMSEGAYNFSILLGGVSWFTNSSAASPSGWLRDIYSQDYPYNASVVRYSTNWQILYADSAIIETKGPYVWLLFEISGMTASPVWAVLDFYVYLRNE